ncbi:MAG TPA: carbohydrate porin [Planctomycetaceae bacterium]|nr:carbohydrate porin [Planctomycetaceae bacterium]
MARFQSAESEESTAEPAVKQHEETELPSASTRFPSAFPEYRQGTAPGTTGEEADSNLPLSTRFPSAFPESKASGLEPEKPTWYSIHAQATTITQKNNDFRSPYAGPHSFLPDGPQATSGTATLFTAAKLWEGTEVVFNPEVAGGAGLSNVLGIAGFPNGEMTKVGAVEPIPYLARLYIRQTWGLGGEQEKIAEAQNTVAGTVDIDRVVLVLGRMAAPDLFDDNRFSDDPRSQFMNWSLMLNGAWDYAADTRGYTYGGGITLNRKEYALRYAVFAVPTAANGYNFDPKILLANAHNLEYQRNFSFNERPGHLHLLAYLNRAHMGSYSESLAQMPVHPDITATRAYRSKYGFGASLDLELTDNLGVFSRLGWNNGQTESFMFTEIDRTASLGLAYQGTRWGRRNDQVGLAGVINAISGVHAAYLAAGGLGFQLGDGALNYGYEEILETYYRIALRPGMHFTVDFQGIENPGYNRDRGPVAVGSARFHFEF